MKTEDQRLEELKEEVAKKIGFKDWDDARHDLDESFIFEFAKIYATECILASLYEASENAELDFVDDEPIYGYVGIKKESIINPENIILL